MDPDQNLSTTSGTLLQWDVLLLESQTTRVTLAFVFSVAAIGGTTGDFLMLYVYTRHCRGDQRKKYLFGIALAALVISLIYYPLFILELLRPDVIIRNLELCLLTKYTKMFAFLFYIFSVAIASLWNYIFFAFPLKGRIWIQKSRVVLVWSTALVLAGVISTIGYLLMERPQVAQYTFMCWSLDHKSSEVFIKIMVLGVIIPCMVLTLHFNCYVFRLAGRVRRTLRAQQSSGTYPNTNAQKHHLLNIPLKQSGKKQSCLTGIIFLFTWIPFLSVILLRVFCRPCIDLLLMLIIGDLSFFLASFAPLLMFLLTRKYRRALLYVLSCGRRGGRGYYGGSTRNERSFSSTPF